MLADVHTRVHRYARTGLVAAIVIATLWTLPRFDDLDTAQLGAWLRSFGPFAPLIFIVVRTAGSAAFVPGSVMAFAAGAFFGPFEGAVYNLIASTAGAILAFGIARYLAPNWIADHVVHRVRLKRLINGIATDGWKFVAFVRLVPLFPYSIVNYAFGLTPVRFVDYAWASAVFMIPADIAYVYLGFAGREALSGNQDAWLLALWALAVIACLSMLPAVYRYYRRRN